MNEEPPALAGGSISAHGEPLAEEKPMLKRRERILHGSGKETVDKAGRPPYNKQALCESAGIGRQARLRGVCRMACGFKSHLSHQ